MEQGPNALNLMGMWLSGHSIADQTLWGVKVLWFGRFGKLIQFASAFTIIVELVGFDRIRLALGINAQLPPEEQQRANEMKVAKVLAFYMPYAFVIIALIVGALYYKSSLAANLLHVLAPPFFFVSALVGMGMFVWAIAIALFTVGEHGVKWFAYVMLIVGFTLDFFAS